MILRPLTRTINFNIPIKILPLPMNLPSLSQRPILTIPHIFKHAYARQDSTMLNLRLRIMLNHSKHQLKRRKRLPHRHLTHIRPDGANPHRRLKPTLHSSRPRTMRQLPPPSTVTPHTPKRPTLAVTIKLLQHSLHPHNHLLMKYTPIVSPARTNIPT